MPTTNTTTTTTPAVTLAHARQLALARLVRIVAESDDDAQARLAAAAILRVPDDHAEGGTGGLPARASDVAAPAMSRHPDPLARRSTPHLRSASRADRTPDPSVRDIERLIRSLERGADQLLAATPLQPPRPSRPKLTPSPSTPLALQTASGSAPPLCSSA